MFSDQVGQARLGKPGQARGYLAPEAGHDLRRYRLGSEPVSLCAHRPYPRLATLRRQCAADENPVRDVEARAAELADLGFVIDEIAELDRHDEAGADLDQRH